jgi:hypothetical protein
MKKIKKPPEVQGAFFDLLSVAASLVFLCANLCGFSVVN